MSGRTRGVVFLGAAALLIVAAVATLAGSGQMTQPIAFNHKKHTENNVSCPTCHQSYDTSSKAGIPDVQVCTRCHEDVVYLSSEKRRLLQYVTGQASIPWQQVYDVPPHVLFSHRRHIVVAKLECSRCHGDVAQMVEPFVKPAKSVKMDDCIDCHRAVYRNPNECILCHR